MKNIFPSVLLIFISLSAYAQQTVSGIISEAGTDTPLPGVAILVKDTSRGVTTDFDGNYSIEEVGPEDVLIFSYVGFKTREIVVGNQTNISLSLEMDTQMMDEIVVTALNIQRDKESLGYSVSQLNANEVNVARENNVMNSLNGKVSGLQITQTGNGVDASSRILLRGINTISGNNRPLVVIDGIPMSNGSSGSNGGVDRGDQLSDINPDDVASISVLKGSGAAAAYGSLGMHGVILITTKSGTRQKGVGITFNSIYNLTSIALTPDLQNQYGTGAYGKHPEVGSNGRPNLDYPNSWSWGPKMTGGEYTNWLGNKATYSPNPNKNPYREFYDNGHSLANTVTFEGQNDKGSFRLSITDENAQGIVSNNTLSKQTFSIRGSSQLTDDLKIDGKMTYLTSKVKNRPELGEGNANTSLQLSLMPRDIRLSDVKNNTVNEKGEEIKWHIDNTFNNPYWALDNTGNEDERDRFQGFLSADWKISSDFSVIARTGMDYLFYDYTSFGEKGAKAVANGQGNYRHDSGKKRIWDTNILGTYSTDIADISTSISLGFNYRNEYGSNRNIWGEDSKSRKFYKINNYKKTYSSEGLSEKAVVSAYLLGQFSYGNYLYLDATLRNDRSSALPKRNNSYWYHSENLSLLFSKLLNLESGYFSQGKIRASFARVGNDTGPYRTQTFYNPQQTTTLPYAVASIPGDLPSSDLRPEISNSWEIGTELGFFDNRIQLDFTYYSTQTIDQIMGVRISGASSFSKAVINAGEMQSKGIETQLNLVPIDTEDLRWDLGITLTKSNSKVISLNKDLDRIRLGSLWDTYVEAVPGEEFGTIYGADYKRDNFGRKLITDAGLAQKGEIVKLGNINPDFYGGITNKVRYKNLSLSALISFQKGGEFFSYGRAYRVWFGTDVRSLEGREKGIIEEGINENTGFKNETAIQAILSRFTNIYANKIRQDLILDATHVKLRELSVTYQFPQHLLEGMFIQSASISAIGRNLFFLYNAAEDIDPEGMYSSGSASTAFEHSALPSTRNYGINLKINF